MRVLTPETLDDAVAMLANEAATPIAGGTDLLVHWPQRLADHDRTYLDLSRLGSLRAHAWSDDRLTLGALTSYWDIVTDPRAQAELPMLVAAARTVGAIQIQTRGTWAGNIVNASPAADGVPALMALDAEVVLASAAGEERVRLDGFYRGYKQMARRPDQLVTAIDVPLEPRSFQSFVKVGSRRAQAITKIGLAITRPADGWRVVANSMAPTVRRCPSVEALLDAETPTTSPGGFAEAIRADVSPIDDIRSTAAYRERVMARALFYELAPVCPWIGGGSSA